MRVKERSSCTERTEDKDAPRARGWASPRPGDGHGDGPGIYSPKYPTSASFSPNWKSSELVLGSRQRRGSDSSSSSG